MTDPTDGARRRFYEGLIGDGKWTSFPDQRFVKACAELIGALLDSARRVFVAIRAKVMRSMACGPGDLS